MGTFGGPHNDVVCWRARRWDISVITHTEDCGALRVTRFPFDTRKKRNRRTESTQQCVCVCVIRASSLTTVFVVIFGVVRLLGTLDFQEDTSAWR